jgi:hypothetical protein
VDAVVIAGSLWLANEPSIALTLSKSKGKEVAMIEGHSKEILHFPGRLLNAPLMLAMG